MKFRTQAFLAICMLTLAACHSSTSGNQASAPIASAPAADKGKAVEIQTVKKNIEGANARVRCDKPNSDPIAKPSDLIHTLNALPKPVSVACLIDVLDRPLTIAASSNVFSAQPSNGANSPRIFIYLNDLFTLSVVPTGDSGKVIEFGYQTTDGKSVKGEIAFPITENLAEDSAYTKVMDQDGENSVCGSCHFPESSAREVAPLALKSTLLPIETQFRVDFKDMQKIHLRCKDTKSDECEVIEALFFEDRVQDKN